MKKLLLVITIIIGFLTSANAQERTKMADGIYLVSYGNTYVIENENLQRTETITITQKKKSTGEEVYEVLCGNAYSKTVAKYSLSSAIAGALAATGVGSWASGLAGALTSTIYDKVCNYYKERYNY